MVRHLRLHASLAVLAIAATACNLVGDTQTLPPLPVIEASEDPNFVEPSPEPTVVAAPTATPDATPTDEPTEEPTEEPTADSGDTASLPRSGNAPWSRTIPRSDAVTTVGEWEDASNRSECAALGLVDIDPLGDGWDIRGATFIGGWGVAFDLPDGPGRAKSGDRCEDCGRGAFGVAGLPEEWDSGESPADDEDEVIEYTDGSVVGWSRASDPSHWLAHIKVPGQSCRYEVWSFVSEDHLERVLARLRLVSGTD